MNNIKKIQEKLIEKNLDAVLVTDEKNQRYATGFPFTDGAVIVARSAAWLITDSRYIEAATNTAACCCNVQMFDREHSRLSLIQAALKEAGVERLGAEEGKLSHAEYLGYEKALGMELLPAQAIFSELRASKSEEEIGYLREAQAISEKALAEVLRIIKPGMTERQVAAELVYHMLLNGSEGNSFDPIVITGKKTSMPHGVPGDEVIHEGDFVTMDFGCLKHGYCSDMTRTVAVGYATDEMKHVYDTVLKAQLTAIAATKAGVPGKDIDGTARKVIADAGYGEYFGHSYGHGVGLEIHEGPNMSFRYLKEIPAGAVTSAEPGIYLPGKFGVRIEDVTIVTADGCEDITNLPKDLLII